MFNVIPRFIADKTEKSNYSGSFKGSVLHLDIRGFTNLTEKLMISGDEGIEFLSKIINKIYKALIKKIYEEGGFVSSFAGDALYVVFKDITIKSAFISSVKIAKIFKGKSIYYFKCNNFSLSAKFGLSYGEIYWQIFGEDKKIYSFSGKPFDDAVKYSKKSKLFTTLNKNIKTVDKNYNRKRISKLHKYKIKKKTLKLYYPENILNQSLSGEFRYVVPLFINIALIKNSALLNEYIIKIIKKNTIYNGYINSLEITDKGSIILILFGAPLSYENNIFRALELACSIRDEFMNKVKFGINHGPVYGGFVGSSKRCTYTVLGDVVNTSYRLMESADWGQICIPSNMLNKTEDLYKVIKIEERNLKGKSDKIFVYDLIARKKQVDFVKTQSNFIGRESVLRNLKKIVNPIFKGIFAGIVWVEGEGGIGKTRLVAEFEKLYINKCKFYLLRADDIKKTSFYLIITFFKNYFNITENDSSVKRKEKFEKTWLELFKSIEKNEKYKELAEELIRTKPFLSDLISIKFDRSSIYSLDPELKYNNTLIAIKVFFKVLSIISPIILVFDDFQWIDKDSINSLKHLVTNLDDYPILLILITRRIKENNLQLFENTSKIFNINLNKMRTNESRKIIRNILGFSCDNHLYDFIEDKSSNIPFYIEQYCYYLKENSMIELIGKKYYLKKGKKNIPPNISELLISRIDKFSRSLKILIKNASVLGLEFDIKVLLLMLKMKDIKMILSEGENEKIIFAITVLKYIFQHTMIRETAYDMQLKGELKKMHLRAARCTEKLYGEGEKYYSDISYHFEKGENLSKTRKYLELAADFSSTNYRNNEAIETYSRLIKYIKSKKKKINIKLKIANLMIKIGKWREAKNIYNECIINSRKIGDQNKIIESMIGFGWVQRREDYQSSLNTFLKVEKLIKISPDKNNYLTILDHIALSMLNLSRIEESECYYRLLLKTAKKLKDERYIAKAYSGISFVFWHKGELDKALKYIKLTENISSSIDDLETLSAAYGNLGSLYFHKNEFDRAMEYYIKLMDLSKKIGDLHALAISYNNIGNIYTVRNEYDKAVEYYKKRIEYGRESVDYKGIALAESNIGSIMYIQGKYNKSIDYFNKMKIKCERIGDRKLYALALGNLSNAYNANGNFIKAEECARKKIKIEKKYKNIIGLAVGYHNLAETYYNTGRYELALRNLNKRLKIENKYKNKRKIALTLFEKGIVYRIKGDYRKSIKNFNKARSIFEELQLSLNIANTKNQIALIYFLKNEINEAENYNNKAIEILDNIGVENKFVYKILKLKIIARKDKKEAVIKIENLLIKTDDIRQKGEILTLLYELTKLKKYRNKALKIHRENKNSIPLYKYKEAMKILS